MGGILDVKIVVIIFFVLCGFVNFGFIGVVVGVFFVVVLYCVLEIV